MSDQLQKAIALIKSGDKENGKQLLAEILKTEPQNEAAWLWMSSVVNKDEEQRYCLERALAINPDSIIAERGLARLARRQEESFQPVDMPEQAIPFASETQPEMSESSLSTIPLAATNESKPTSRALKLGIALGVGFLACGTIGVVGYLLFLSLLKFPGPDTRLDSAETPYGEVTSVFSTQEDIDDLPTQVLNTTTAARSTNTPAQVPQREELPAEPTATPPGEDITDPDYLQGKAAYETKDYQEVLRLMALVLAANPNLAPPHWYRGMAYYYTNNYQAGLEEMQKALDIDPDYALGYADRGLMYSALGDEGRAMADWQKALSLDPTLAKVHHNIAVAYYNQGDYARAVEEYTMALTIDPNRAQTWNDKSEALLNLGQYQDCIDSASQALDLQPDMWSSYYTLGTCKASLGQYASAIPDLDAYLNVVKDNPRGWYNRGLSHRFLGHNQEAMADYTRAIELDPTFTWALINRGNVYVDLKEYELALADYNAALAFGDIPRAYVGRGDVYWGLARYDEAVVEYLEAIRLLPGYPDAYARLARAYLGQNEYMKAIEAADSALDLDTGANWGIIMQTRGRAYYGLGDYERAIDDLSQVIRTHPSVMDFYYRGIAYQASGQKQEAIQDLEFFLAQGGAQDQARIEDAKARLSELRE